MNESQGCNATLKTFYLLQFPASWHSKKTMNIQSDKYISKSSETLNNDQNFSGVKQSCHRYGLNNQALQLFEHFRQSAYRQDASYNAHNMRLSSILEMDFTVMLNHQQHKHSSLSQEPMDIARILQMHLNTI